MYILFLLLLLSIKRNILRTDVSNVGFRDVFSITGMRTGETLCIAWKETINISVSDSTRSGEYKATEREIHWRKGKLYRNAPHRSSIKPALPRA